ncbi:Uncharacterized protein FKW44_014747 [Caligus rogercresseyi]|uniref:Retrovirus-related Pol polyprotein from type-1 retrotransposable element R2 n=1 Tax=Caligus rogercresseyi TaxID=217165 RepID=A0A7T8H070_CALRO|nr:Uncharacterized protein FKW44_014747 [Caligus rogercresseyi]
MNVSDAYKYLGVVFTAKGMVSAPILEGIQEGLGRLNGIGLTVFERYITLRDHLIPRLVYSLTYGKVSQSQVRQAEQVVRLAVRDWMKLARDTPREFYYAPTSAGGLALNELEVRRKLFHNKRMSSLRDSKDPIIRAIIAQDPKYVRPQQAIIGGLLYRDSDKAETLYAKALWAKTDTCGLASTAQGHRNFMFLTDRGQKHNDATFCAAVQIMAGAPLTKAKRARFTQLPNRNKCESCGDRIKNLQHILQVCPRVRGARIKRHDQVQALLEVSLKAKNKKFHKDNIIPMGGTVRKPDLVIIDEKKISVVDPTIVSDTLSLQESSKLRWSL